MLRTDKFLQQKTFNKYHSETELLRYIHKLARKDLSLVHSMIPLGSCTMKLNSATALKSLTIPHLNNMHPFAPLTDAQGYQILFSELKKDLMEITGLDGVSLQPNSGSQGEYAGLRMIKAYLDDIGQNQRDICFIPISAHGTNPASSRKAGLQVVNIQTNNQGEIDMDDLQEKLNIHKNKLAAMMITYPSTYGFFEQNIVEVCDAIHSNGGLIYLDGANMNAKVGLCKLNKIIDVIHLNLHKTFSIPHGGGGPGAGPILFRKHLIPYAPTHSFDTNNKSFGVITSSPWGSSNILPISWAYIKMLGNKGLKKSTQVAILNANYMAHRLKNHYPIVHKNKNGMVAHEFIIDLRQFKAFNITENDVAKRLQDYGFHSPTMSWPIVGTLMIEPTECENLEQMDRFCDSMISIYGEIKEIEAGLYDKNDNLLKNAPHTIEMVSSDNWNKKYSREQAAYPLEWLRDNKFWPSCRRVDDAYGDTNLKLKLSE